MDNFLEPEVILNSNKYGAIGEAWEYLMTKSYYPDLGTGLLMRPEHSFSNVLKGNKSWSEIGLAPAVAHEVNRILKGYAGDSFSHLAIFMELLHRYRERFRKGKKPLRYHLCRREASLLVDIDYNLKTVELPEDFMGYISLDDGIYETRGSDSFYSGCYVYAGKLSNYYPKNAIEAMKARGSIVDENTRVVCMMIYSKNGQSEGMYLSLNGERVLSNVLGKVPDSSQLQAVDSNCKLFLNCAVFLNKKG